MFTIILINKIKIIDFKTKLTFNNNNFYKTCLIVLKKTHKSFMNIAAIHQAKNKCLQ